MPNSRSIYCYATRSDLHPLKPQSVAMRTLLSLIEQRRELVD